MCSLQYANPKAAFPSSSHEEGHFGLLVGECSYQRFEPLEELGHVLRASEVGEPFAS